jgi:hypothetical protein
VNAVRLKFQNQSVSVASNAIRLGNYHKKSQMLYGKQENTMAHNHGAWIDALFQAVGKNVHLETSDGIIREGRMSGLRTKDIKFNRKVQSVVTELELNGDPSDCVPLSVLSVIEIDTPHRGQR